MPGPAFALRPHHRIGRRRQEFDPPHAGVKILRRETTHQVPEPRGIQHLLVRTNPIAGGRQTQPHHPAVSSIPRARNISVADEAANRKGHSRGGHPHVSGQVGEPLGMNRVQMIQYLGAMSAQEPLPLRIHDVANMAGEIEAGVRAEQRGYGQRRVHGVGEYPIYFVLSKQSSIWLNGTPSGSQCGPSIRGRRPQEFRNGFRGILHFRSPCRWPIHGFLVSLPIRSVQVRGAFAVVPGDETCPRYYGGRMDRPWSGVLWLSSAARERPPNALPGF